MKGRARRVALIFLGLMCLLLATLALVTWRVVRRERLNQALIDAVKRNDDRAVVSLLSLGADANCRDEPLRRFSLWQTLMQMVRRRQSQPSHAPTPLLIALKLLPPQPRNKFGTFGPDVYPPENVSLVRALLDHGAQTNITDEGGNAPLNWSILSGKNATVRILLSRGVKLEQSTLDESLVWAIANEQIPTDVITDLLNHGADVNAKGHDETTSLDDTSALCIAIYTQRVDVVRLLLARHADPALDGTIYDLTPLELAVQQDSVIDDSGIDVPQLRQIIHLLKAAGARE